MNTDKPDLEKLARELLVDIGLPPNQALRKIRSTLEQAYANGVHDTYLNYRDMPQQPRGERWIWEKHFDRIVIRAGTMIVASLPLFDGESAEQMCDAHNASIGAKP